MDSPYSGALIRSATPHFSAHPSVPGVNPEHEHPSPDPDPFSPNITAPAAQAGDVWQPRDETLQSDMPVRPIHHWTDLQDPVPSNVHSYESNIAATDRMIANHSVVDFRADQYTPYKNATMGRSVEYVDGRVPWQSGENVPEESAYLQMGRNAYDVTNKPNEVYEGDSANVGRYRLGKRIDMFGMYQFWTKQGQDAELRAYSGLEPAFPVDKPRQENTAPYTPNSRGTDTWTLSAFQDPSLFTAPSETSNSDFMLASGDVVGGDSGFSDDGRL